MISGFTFVIKFIWYEFIRDTFLIFEQFFYVSILSGLVPGSIFFMDWILS